VSPDINCDATLSFSSFFIVLNKFTYFLLIFFGQWSGINQKINFFLDFFIRNTLAVAYLFSCLLNPFYLSFGQFINSV
jgi:hypothetical protein